MPLRFSYRSRGGEKNMTSRHHRFKKPEELENDEEQTTRGRRSLLTDQPLAIYVRQSRLAQKEDHRVSREIQTEELVEYALKLGWPRELIETYDDTGLTAVLGINERERLFDLYGEIKAGRVKTVLIYMIDRLFRDEFLNEATRFGEKCAKNGVMLITYHGHVYDMREERDYGDFISECIWAYHSYKNGIIRRMCDARAMIGKRGEYDGRSLAWGFMRDPVCDYTIAVYVPHAKVVRETLFPRFIELDFNQNKFAREFDGVDLFPPIPAHLAKYFHTPKGPEAGGWYRLGKHALLNTLCNPMYIGWWGYLGYWIKDHHLAIVDEATFWLAFHHTSTVDIDGNSIVRAKRYEQAETEECPALLKRLLEGETKDESITTYPDRQRSDGIVRWGYKLYDSVYSHNRKLLANVKATVIDDAVVGRLLDLLKNQKVLEDYHTRIQKQTRVREERRSSLQEELDGIEKGLKAAFRIMSDPDVDQDAYNEAKRMRRELQTRKSKIEAELLKQHPIDKLNSENTPEKLGQKQVPSYPELLKKIGENWHSGIFTTADRRQLLEEFCEKVTIRKLSAHFLKLCIYWHITEQPEDVLLWYAEGDHPHWTEEDERLLQEHYPDQDKLIALFPHRSWTAILRHAYDMGIYQSYHHRLRYADLEDLLTPQDKQVMASYGIFLSDVTKGQPRVLLHRGKPHSGAVPQICPSSATML